VGVEVIVMDAVLDFNCFVSDRVNECCLEIVFHVLDCDQDAVADRLWVNRSVRVRNDTDMERVCERDADLVPDLGCDEESFDPDPVVVRDNVVVADRNLECVLGLGVSDREGVGVRVVLFERHGRDAVCFVLDMDKLYVRCCESVIVTVSCRDGVFGVRET